jgi:hypothetical protein
LGFKNDVMTWVTHNNPASRQLGSSAAWQLIGSLVALRSGKLGSSVAWQLSIWRVDNLFDWSLTTFS